MANGLNIFSGLVDCIRYRSHWFWPPFYLTHTLPYVLECAESHVFLCFCLKFRWHNKCVYDGFCILHFDPLNPWIRIRQLCSWYSIVRAQIMCYRLQGRMCKMRCGGMRWHTKTLCLFCTYNWRGVHTQSYARKTELGGEAFKRCLIFVWRSSNSRFVYFFSIHMEIQLIQIDVRSVRIYTIRNQRCKSMISLN